MSREAAAFSVILQPVSAAPDHPHSGEKEPCQNSRSWHPDWADGSAAFSCSSYRWRTDIGIFALTHDSSRKQCCCLSSECCTSFSRSYQSILYCRRSRQCQRERPVFAVQLLQKVQSAFIGISLVRPEAHIKGVRFHGGRIRDAEINRSLPAAGSRAAYLPIILCCLFCCCIRSRNS